MTDPQPPVDSPDRDQGSRTPRTPTLGDFFWVGTGCAVSVVGAGAIGYGLDAWLRWGLESSGVQPLYLPPGVIATVFLVWSWLVRGQRPADLGP